jgi:O-antigen ligase
MHSSDWIIIAALSAVPVTTALGLLIHEGGLWVLDRPLRLLLAVPIFLAFRIVGLRTETLLTAAGWSAVVFGFAAVWDISQGFSRAVGQAGHPIVFGNTALLMVLISLWGLLHQESIKASPRLPLLLKLGLAAGLIASLASGSRGGWLFALPMACYMLMTSPMRLTLSVRHLLVLSAFGVLLLVAFGPQVVERLTPVFQGVRFALQSEAPPPAELLSIAARVDMWREAIHAWSHAPFIGAGPERFLAALDARAALGYMEPGRVHAHNEVLTQLAMFGLFGLAGLLLFALGLGYAFHAQQSPMARLGLVVLSTYLLFGLTDSMLSMMNRVELYAVLLAVCAGAMRHAQLSQVSARKESQDSQAGHCQA